MTFSSYLPGLLSRVGPSLFSPAMLYEPVSVSYPSTNTLLDVFQPQPDTGDVYVPLAGPGGSSARTVKAGYVESDRHSEVRSTLETLLEEGLRFVRDDESPMVSRRDPLPATEGAWFVGEPLGGAGRGDKGLSFFHPATRRIVRVSLFSAHGLSATVGWQADHLRITQEVALGARGELDVGGYQFDFKGPALEGLKALIGMPSKSGADLALEIAARIYFSGQYTPEESGCSLQSMGKSGRWRNLQRTNNVWRLPEESIHPLVIGTRRTLQRRDGSKLKLPVAETYWESQDARSGHLVVRLHNLPGRRLPLDPGLKSLLWDGALSLMYQRPG